MDKIKKPEQGNALQDAQEMARDVTRVAAGVAQAPTHAALAPVAVKDAPAQEHMPSLPEMGAYGPQAAAQIDLTKDAWKAVENHRASWSEDPKSRLAVRMFSRGLMGAAFFTAGGLLTKKWMTGKNSYDPLKALSEQKNPLQVIAKLIDSGLGVPIEATVTKLAGKEAGLNSVRFRQTRYRSFGNEMRGRSLGDEAVNITFDFFSASVGDALGRDMAAWIDPNAKKTWMDDQGRINLPKAAQSALEATMRYITYNGGEDWAVAIPYAYFMKGQRKLIEHASPGFQYDFDRQLNGGSFKMKNNQIVGNYNKEGALDLQSRFTVYNIGTLMYREAYDYVGNMLSGQPSTLYGAPEVAKHERKGLVEKAGDLVKWAARSAVKGTIIMTPAVPLFWITRTPQTKHRGLFIDPEKGILGRPPTGAGFKGDSIHTNTPDIPSGSTYVDYWHYRHNPNDHNLNNHHYTSPGTTVGHIDPTLVHVPGASGNSFDAHARTFGPADAVLNSFGKANYEIAHAATGPSKWLDTRVPSVTHSFKEMLGIKNHNDGRFMRPMVYASTSYTPYMYAKSEFANLWDNGKMDMAAERMIDGAAKLNWGEFKKGAHEVYKAVAHQPFEDAAREVEAQRRILVDTSPADSFRETQAAQNLNKKPEQAMSEGSSWRDRLISGPPVEKKILAQREEKAFAKKVSYAEQESMRKALEDLSPPTNAIN